MHTKIVPTLHLTKEELRQKVYGGLLGKNAAGSLGTPYEKAFGQDDMIEVKVEHRLYPNDDFEMQMAWLQVLEERGLDITEQDLAQCWLDCIFYNWDEYGLSKRNLMLGIKPPLSGYFNNWFKHCMGSPIRSEIWAMIAPGLPDVAARYAFMDAIVDHGGGESVYGEVFNAALESLAFVESDIVKVIEAALSYIPQGSLTYRSIRTALDSYRAGLDIREARRRIIELAPREYRKIAQYSPINLGFETLGLLYGRDFEDAVVKTISLGYDTDSTAATVGAVLGILHGPGYMPSSYAKVYEEILTNESWGGIGNVRFSRTVTELTERVVKVTYRLLSRYRDRVFIDEDGGVKWLINPLEVKPSGEWLSYRPNTEWHRYPGIFIEVEYSPGPAITDRPITVSIRFRSMRIRPIRLNYTVYKETMGLEVSPKSGVVVLSPRQETTLDIGIKLEHINELDTIQHLLVRLEAEGSFEDISIPITVLAPFKWHIRLVQEGDEDVVRWVSEAIKGSWSVLYRAGHDLELTNLIPPNSTIAIVGFIHNPGEPRLVNVGIPNNAPEAKLWINGELIVHSKGPNILRPNYGGDGKNYREVLLRRGWNTVAIKVKRIDEPVNAHFMISESSRILHRGIIDLEFHKTPEKLEAREET